MIDKKQLMEILAAPQISTQLRMGDNSQVASASLDEDEDDEQEHWLQLQSVDRLIQALHRQAGLIDNMAAASEREFALIQCIKGCKLTRDKPSYWLMLKILATCYDTQPVKQLEEQLQIFIAMVQVGAAQRDYECMRNKLSNPKATCFMLIIVKGLSRYNLLSEFSFKILCMPTFNLEHLAQKIKDFLKNNYPLTFSQVEEWIQTASLHKDSFRRLLIANEPQNIKFAQAPDGAIEDMSRLDFEKRFHAHYTEGLWALPKQFPLVIPKKLSFEYMDKLFICQLPPPINYALRTQVDIPSGTLLLPYSGIYTPKGAPIIYDPIYSLACGSEDNYSATVSSYLLRGYGAFIMNAPREGKYKPGAEKFLNSNVAFCMQDGYPYVVTTCDVLAGEWLALDYNWDWNDQAMQLVRPDGTFLPKDYPLDHYIIHFDHTSYRLNRSAIVENLSKTITEPRQLPLRVAHSSYSVPHYILCSFFLLRHKLGRIHAIPQIYGSIHQFDSVLNKLHNKLLLWQSKQIKQYIAAWEMPEGEERDALLKKAAKKPLSYSKEAKTITEPIRLLAFWHDVPLLGHTVDNLAPQRVDVVCHTKSKKDHNIALRFFEQKTPAKVKVVNNSSIEEIVLSGIDLQAMPGFHRLFN